MNNELMAKGMVLGMRSMGIEIDDWEDSFNSTTIYISVPKETNDTGPDGFSLAGKPLADRLMTKMKDMGCKNFNVKFRIRNEIWTKEKRLAAVEQGKRDMYGNYM